jgi:hypothetical protein
VSRAPNGCGAGRECPRGGLCGLQAGRGVVGGASGPPEPSGGLWGVVEGAVGWVVVGVSVGLWSVGAVYLARWFFIGASP